MNSHSGSNDKISRPIIISILGLAILIGLTYQGISEQPSHIYLVKLYELPIFIPHSNNVGLNSFDNLTNSLNAHVEDLYPDNNTGDIGRWIVVTCKNNIERNLWRNNSVTEVEDGTTIYGIDALQNMDNSNESVMSAAVVNNDKTWGIRIPKVEEGLEALKPIREIIVGVIDTGCDLRHPALQDNFVKGRNFAGGNENDPSNRTPQEMHATHVAGTIIARRGCNKFFGIANGIAKVMPIRVLNEYGTGTVRDISRGVIYAADHGVNVINMSLGGPSYSRAFHDAIKYAVNVKNVTVVCAKGNSNTDKSSYPAEFPEVIRVTATSLLDDNQEARAPFSNYGKSSTCSAPGHFTYSTLPGGKYGFASGTSMACPHVTGCVAVILSQEKFTPGKVKSIVESYGDELKTDKQIGQSINLLKFVQRAKNNPPPLKEIEEFTPMHLLDLEGIIEWPWYSLVFGFN